MTKVEPIPNESIQSGSEVVRAQLLSPALIDHILQRLSCIELPAKDHLERYMRHKWRLNHKPRTLASSFTSVVLLLEFYGESGERELGEMERADLEAFIEQEQDRGLRISSVRTRLACMIAFLHFLMEQDIVPGSLLKRGIKLKLPEVLPRQ
jgi:integrase/recombinase XerD